MSETVTEVVKKPRTRKSRAKPKPEPEAGLPAAPPVFAAIGAALESLERGISTSDWGEVASAYQMLTGKKAPASRRPDALLMLRDIGDSIGRYLDGTSLPARLPEATPSRVEPRQTDESEVQSVTTVEDGYDPLVEESRLLSAQLAGREKLTRPAFQLVDATCGRCGKTQKVNPSLVPPRVASDDDRPPFICNRCVSR